VETDGVIKKPGELCEGRVPKSEVLQGLMDVPPTWLQKSASGGHFENYHLCLERLSAYGFLEGYLFVTGRYRPGETPNWQFEVVLVSESDGEAANEEEDQLAVDQLAEDDISPNFEDEMATLDPFPSAPTALPPASTAPPALGRGKRQRAHTERYEEGIDTGLIGESQHGAIGRPQKKRAE
jgi:hypothetical protein